LLQHHIDNLSNGSVCRGKHHGSVQERAVRDSPASFVNTSGRNDVNEISIADSGKGAWIPGRYVLPKQVIKGPRLVNGPRQRIRGLPARWRFE
jgi:hypothetical protein